MRLDLQTTGSRPINNIRCQKGIGASNVKKGSVTMNGIDERRALCDPTLPTASEARLRLRIRMLEVPALEAAHRDHEFG
jgi:hypothetical protein